MKIPVPVAVDPKLTRGEAEPAAPARACRDAESGRATLCEGALADYAVALRTWGRKLQARLAAIAGLQPVPPAGAGP